MHKDLAAVHWFASRAVFILVRLDSTLSRTRLQCSMAPVHRTSDGEWQGAAVGQGLVDLTPAEFQDCTP